MTILAPRAKIEAEAEMRPASWRRICNHVFTLPNILTAVYLVTGGALLMRHGLWRDEAQAFLIARDSPSLKEMFAVTQYEGHPPLWHILLWFLTRATVRPEAMQWLHLLMAAGSVYLVARFSPLPVAAKILFAFGYFTLFEYGIIARNYQIFMLLTLAFCAVWQMQLGRGRRPFIWLAALLFLLCFTHVAGIILAAGLGVMLLLDSVLTRDGWRAIRKHWLQFPLALFIAGFGAWLSVKVLRPPADESFSRPEWYTEWNAVHADPTLATLWNGYVPIPQWNDMHFWNSNFLAAGGPSSLVVKNPAAARLGTRIPPTAAKVPPPNWPWGAPSTRGMAIALAALALMLLSGSWRAAVFFLVSTLGLLAFAYSKFEGNVRHDGPYFVALVAAFWIAWATQRTTAISRWRRMVRAVPRAALTGLLALQVVAAYVACYYAWNFPFSPAREAAQALAPQLTKDDLLMSDYSPITASLAAYLPGRKFWLSDSSRWGTFTIWKNMPRSPSGPGAAIELASRTGKPVVLVEFGNRSSFPGAEFLGGFSGGITGDENYYFYRFKPGAGSGNPGMLNQMIKGLGF